MAEVGGSIPSAPTISLKLVAKSYLPKVILNGSALWPEDTRCLHIADVCLDSTSAGDGAWFSGLIGCMVTCPLNKNDSILNHTLLFTGD